MFYTMNYKIHFDLKYQLEIANCYYDKFELIKSSI